MQCGRTVGRPARGFGLGYRGTEGACEKILESVKVAKRKTSPTFLGRIYGKSFDDF